MNTRAYIIYNVANHPQRRKNSFGLVSDRLGVTFHTRDGFFPPETQYSQLALTVLDRYNRSVCTRILNDKKKKINTFFCGGGFNVRTKYIAITI